MNRVESLWLLAGRFAKRRLHLDDLPAKQRAFAVALGKSCALEVVGLQMRDITQTFLLAKQDAVALISASQIAPVS